MQYQIQNGLDDVHQRLTTAQFGTTASPLTIGNVNATNKQFRVGLRFPGIVAPGSKRLASASLILTAGTTRTGTTCVSRIAGWAHDNSPRIGTSGAFDTAFAAKTTAYSTLTNISGWTAEQRYSFDVTAIVAEIVARGGWASGNAITIFIDDDADASSLAAHRQFHTADTYPAKAAILDVTWKTAGASGLLIGVM